MTYKLSDFHPGDCVKINPDVYKNEWDRWEELFHKYWHHNLYVDRIVDMSDVDGAESLIVVGYPYSYCNKTAVKPEYLWKT